MKLAMLAIDSKHVDSLHPTERELVATAREKRLAEFATGRTLLRRMLGCAASIGRSDNGSPSLPPGVVGSLAHDDHRAVAVLGFAEQYRAIGVDIEPHGENDAELREAVLREDDPDIDATAAFVMKEAAYKAWSDLGGTPVGPLEVRLRVNDERFTAEMPSPEITVHGTVHDLGDTWLAIAAIPNP